LDEEQSVGNGDRHITTTFLSERHYDATEILPPPPHHHHCYWRRNRRRSRTSSWTSSNRTSSWNSNRAYRRQQTAHNASTAAGALDA
jgi:hypothetical protein